MDRLMESLEKVREYTELWPGPASTVGERPTTNPAIRVRFLSEADGFFFLGGNNMRDIN